MRLRGYLSIGAALALAGCAAQGETAGSTLSGPAPRVDPAGAAGVPAAAGGYKLTAAEMQFDCPRLTGQMKVRMANMRAHYSERSGTATSQAIQTVIAPIYGGTRRGIDPMADLQLDRAKLEAFNRRLAEKKCKTLDIDAELRGEPAGARSK